MNEWRPPWPLWARIMYVVVFGGMTWLYIWLARTYL